jgi:hypothetical protein
MKLRKALAMVCLCGFSTAAFAAQLSGTLTGDYFVINNPDPDLHGEDGDISDLMLPTLGANGLPQYNPAHSPGVTVYDLYNGEVTWWSPAHNSQVTLSSTPSGTISYPFASSAMFQPAPNVGTTDANGLLTAHFHGTFTTPTAGFLSYTLGSDDDSYLYIDGVSLAQHGGIHGNNVTTGTSSTLYEAGQHTIDLFYADRCYTSAALTFGLSLVPEPGSLSLLGLGLLGVALLRRRN